MIFVEFSSGVTLSLKSGMGRSIDLIRGSAILSEGHTPHNQISPVLRVLEHGIRPTKMSGMQAYLCLSLTKSLSSSALRCETRHTAHLRVLSNQLTTQSIYILLSTYRYISTAVHSWVFVHALPPTHRHICTAGYRWVSSSWLPGYTKMV